MSRPTLPAIALLATLLSALGCARYAERGPHAPYVTAGRLRDLHHLASRELSCPMAAITARPIHERVYEAAGCGGTAEFAMVGPLGRGRWRSIDAISARASADLACPATMLAIDAHDRELRAVVGCGRSARYGMACDEHACGWVMTAHAGAWDETGVRPRPRPDVATSSPTDGLRTLIEARRAAVLECSDGAPLALSGRWGADGSVEWGLVAPHPGARAELCVRLALNGLRVSSGEPGEVLHAVQ